MYHRRPSLAVHRLRPTLRDQPDNCPVMVREHAFPIPPKSAGVRHKTARRGEGVEGETHRRYSRYCCQDSSPTRGFCSRTGGERPSCEPTRTSRSYTGTVEEYGPGLPGQRRCSFGTRSVSNTSKKNQQCQQCANKRGNRETAQSRRDTPGSLTKGLELTPSWLSILYMGAQRRTPLGEARRKHSPSPQRAHTCKLPCRGSRSRQGSDRRTRRYW